MTVPFGADPLTLDELLAVAAGEPVRLGTAARTRMAVSRALLTAAIDRGDAVYGSTRRLGAAADEAVDDAQEAFQLQVLRNHRGAVGDPLPDELVRAAIAARLAGLTQGGSGARPEVADGLADLLNRGVVPVVPERGSVGAADLAQLAAVAAVLVGEGAAFGADGTIVAGAQALDTAGLRPLTLQAGEALALLATNAFAVGAAALVAADLATVADAADAAVALSLEAAAAHRASGDLGPFEESVVAVRGPSGAEVSAAAVRGLVAGGELGDPDRERRVQDELSFRCAPQVHGAVHDAQGLLVDVVETELGARAENPLVDVDRGVVVPNGNFLPVELTLALEQARLVLAHLGQISERRIAVLSALQSPFRAASTARLPGLVAYTAAADVAELRQLAAPVSLGVAPLSQVEDVASFAWSAARLAERSAGRAAEVVAIEALLAADLLAAAPDYVPGDGAHALAERLIPLLDVDPQRADVSLEDRIDAVLTVLVSGPEAS